MELLILGIILSMKLVAGVVEVRSWGEGVVGRNRILLYMYFILS